MLESIKKWFYRRRAMRLFPVAKGAALDRLGELYGIERYPRFWFFKESDRRLRQRILGRLSGL